MYYIRVILPVMHKSNTSTLSDLNGTQLSLASLGAPVCPLLFPATEAAVQNLHTFHKIMMMMLHKRHAKRPCCRCTQGHVSPAWGSLKGTKQGHSF